MTKFTTQLVLALGTIILLTPAALVAQSPSHGGGGGHMRPVLFHDRSPRPHVHNIAPHH